VADDIVAGALYDFLGYLTSRQTRITMSSSDDAGVAVDALIEWAMTRKINLVEARVKDWNEHTCSAAPHDKTAVGKKAPFAYFNVGIAYHVKDKILFHKEPTQNLEDRWWGPDIPLYVHQFCREQVLEEAARLLETVEASYGVTDRGLSKEEYARMKHTAREHQTAIRRLK